MSNRDDVFEIYDDEGDKGMFENPSDTEALSRAMSVYLAPDASVRDIALAEMLTETNPAIRKLKFFIEQLPNVQTIEIDYRRGGSSTIRTWFTQDSQFYFQIILGIPDELNEASVTRYVIQGMKESKILEVPTYWKRKQRNKEKERESEIARTLTHELIHCLTEYTYRVGQVYLTLGSPHDPKKYSERTSPVYGHHASDSLRHLIEIPKPYLDFCFDVNDLIVTLKYWWFSVFDEGQDTLTRLTRYYYDGWKNGDLILPDDVLEWWFPNEDFAELLSIYLNEGQDAVIKELSYSGATSQIMKDVHDGIQKIVGFMDEAQSYIVNPSPLRFARVGTWEGDPAAESHMEILTGLLEHEQLDFLAEILAVGKEEDRIDIRFGRDFLTEDKPYDVVMVENVYNDPYYNKGCHTKSPLHSAERWRERLVGTGAKYIVLFGTQDDTVEVTNRLLGDIPGYELIKKMYGMALYKKKHHCVGVTRNGPKIAEATMAAIELQRRWKNQGRKTKKETRRQKSSHSPIKKGVFELKPVYRKLLEMGNLCGKSVLDFGSGVPPYHSVYLESLGFNVTPFDDLSILGADEWINANALDRSYDVVLASNVLNTQSSKEELRLTLEAIAGVLKRNGIIIANYPTEPRFIENLRNEELIEILREYFQDVDLFYGSCRGSRDMRFVVSGKIQKGVEENPTDDPETLWRKVTSLAEREGVEAFQGGTTKQELVSKWGDGQCIKEDVGFSCMLFYDKKDKPVALWVPDGMSESRT